MKIVNIADMPGFDPNGVAQNNITSVTDGEVYWGVHPNMTRRSLRTVQCHRHGAMNCVTKMDHGVLWRCLACNVGAYEAR